MADKSLRELIGNIARDIIQEELEKYDENIKREIVPIVTLHLKELNERNSC